MFDHAIRRAVPIGWVLAAVAGVYLFFVFAMRYGGTVRVPAVPRMVSDIPAAYSGTEPKIAHFYSGSGVITRGESAVVCYGVLNVRSVRLQPAVETLTPSLNRCFAVDPKETTTYTLVAEGTDGRPLKASFTVQVDPAPPRFSMVAISAKEIVRGERWAACYSVENAQSVRLMPNNMSLPLGQKRCFMLYPVQNTEFRLVATGERNMTAEEKIAVRVQARK